MKDTLKRSWDPMEEYLTYRGANRRIRALRRRLRVGQDYPVGSLWYRITQTRTRRLTLVSKEKYFAIFRVDGVLSSYNVCFSYFELLQLGLLDDLV